MNSLFRLSTFILLFLTFISFESFSADQKNESISTLRSFNKESLLQEITAWEKKPKKTKNSKFVEELKNKIERYQNDKLSIAQLQDIIKSVIESTDQKSQIVFAEQSLEIVKQLEPRENPITVIRTFDHFSNNGQKNITEFINSRNYTNSSSYEKANAASLDEAANFVESKIFKNNPKAKTETKPDIDEDSTDDEDLI